MSEKPTVYSQLLDTIEQALLEIGEPASSKSISNFILSRPDYKSSLGGKTPHKTVQARISTDILKFGKSSRFYRFAPSTFALKSLIHHYPSPMRRVYFGFSRQRQIDHSPVLYISTDRIPSSMEVGFFHRAYYPLRLLSRANMFWNPKSTYKKNAAEVVAFIVLVNDGNVLTFEPSNYEEKHLSLLKTVTAGLFGNFKEQDLNLFDDSSIGFNFAIEREVHYFLKHFIEPSEHFIPKPEFLGFVRDEQTHERRNTIGVVACVNIPKIDIDNRRLGYRNLNWRPIGIIPNDFVNFDPWSQYVFAGMADT